MMIESFAESTESITYMHGKFFVLNNKNEIIISNDGITWYTANQKEAFEFFRAIIEELNKRNNTSVWENFKIFLNSIFSR